MKHSLQSLLPFQATPRGRQYTGFWTILLLLFLLQPIHSQTTVDITITCDNAYVFGFGDVDEIILPFPTGVENCLAVDIYYHPETYTSIPATLDGYIYIVTWSDDRVYQGTIAEFTDGSKTILTQPGLLTQWEVFATGIDVDPNCPSGDPVPSKTLIDQQISLANTSTGPPSSSVTWVTESSTGPNGCLEFDPYINNSGTNPDLPFPPNDVAGIGPAQWMWYNPNPLVITDPFVAGPHPDFPPSEMMEYYIFRIGPLGDVFEKPIPTLTEWGMIIFGVLLLGFVTWVFLKRRKVVGTEV